MGLAFVALSSLVLSGCKKEEEWSDLVALVEADAPEGLEVVPTVGGLTLEVPVRQINRYGASVTGGSVTVSLSGSTAVLEDSEEALDPTGYADFDVVATASELFEVIPTGGDAGDLTLGGAVSCWAVEGELPPWDLRWATPLDANELGEANRIVPLLGGVLLADDTNVWYQSSEPGMQPHLVLEMPDPILELEAVHVDNDGVPDAMVRSVEEIVLLRGRSAGGMGWGAAFASQGRAILGASVGDVDGDLNPDLAIALDDGSSTWVSFWAGDGAWGFSELEQHSFGFASVDLQLAQSDEDGSAELNLLNYSSVLKRYYRSDEGWAETYPSSLETNLAVPASFLGAGDLDGDGTEESAMLSYQEGGVEQSVLFFIMDNGNTRYQKSFYDPSFSFADLSGDGLADIVALEVPSLNLIHFQDQDYKYRSVEGLEHQGPLAVGFFDHGGQPDVAVCADALRVYPGVEGGDPWATVSGDWQAYYSDLLAAPLLADLDADGALDTMAAFAEVYSVPVLRVWRVDPADKGGVPGLTGLGDISFDGSTQVLDLDRIGGVFYGLADMDGGVLVRMAQDEKGDFVETGRVKADAVALACGELADGAEVAVVAEDGSASLLDADLNVVGNADLASAHCVVAADTDGDGIDELHAGSAEGCALVAADLDGDGTDELISGGSGEVSVEWDGDSFGMGVDGVPTVADLDLDGQLEVLAADGSDYWIGRPVKGGLAPSFGLWGDTALLSAPIVGDFDGDGLQDLLGLGDEGTLLFLLGVEE